MGRCEDYLLFRFVKIFYIDGGRETKGTKAGPEWRRAGFFISGGWKK